MFISPVDGCIDNLQLSLNPLVLVILCLPGIILLLGQTGEIQSTICAMNAVMPHGAVIKQMAQWVLKPAQWSQCEEMPQATIAGYPWPSVHTAMCSTPLTKTAVEMSGSSVLRASKLH